MRGSEFLVLGFPDGKAGSRFLFRRAAGGGGCRERCIVGLQHRRDIEAEAFRKFQAGQPLESRFDVGQIVQAEHLDQQVIGGWHVAKRTRELLRQPDELWSGSRD